MSARREVAVGLASYAAYLLVRKQVWNEPGRRRAADNAERIVEAEARLGIQWEPAVQRAAMRWPRSVDVINVGYAAGNVALSVGWLIAMYRRGHPAFRRERRAAVAALVGALPVFATFPVAPPRTRDDHHDTLAARGLDLEHPLLVRFYNPIAAMPSHHVAFALVTGLGLAEHSKRRAAWLWRGYPGLVAGVVVASGNHYVLDTVAGAALGGLARALSR